MPSRTSNENTTTEGRGARVARSEPGGRAQRDARTPRARSRRGGTVDLEAQRIPREVRDGLSDDLIDELLGDRHGEQEILGQDGLLGQLTRRLLERALSGELTSHLGYAPHREPEGGTGNTRNGHTEKTIRTDHGQLRIRTPRDRNGTFDPQIVRKNQTRLTGLDEKIVRLYSRGLSVRDIEAELLEIYGVQVGKDTITAVTDEVLHDVKAWQTRPLDRVYPIVYLDALVVKIRDGSSVQNHACYLAIGVNQDGERDVLGIWIQKTEGAKFWLSVLTELKQRGVQDVLVACCDGLTGFPDAIEAVYPKTWVQTCLVHVVRNSLRFVPYKDKKKVAHDLKKIYTATDRDHAETELLAFAETWDEKYPMISQQWHAQWERIVPFLAFPPDLRRAVCTTNTIEALNRQIRKVIKTKGHFPTEDAARKLLYLAIENAQRTWRRTYNWSAARLAFHIHFPDRMPHDAI